MAFMNQNVNYAQGNGNYTGSTPSAQQFNRAQPQVSFGNVDNTQANLNNLLRLVNPHLTDLYNQGRLDYQLCNSFANWINAYIQSGNMYTYLRNNYGNTLASDGQLIQVIDFYINSYMQQQSQSGYRPQPQQPQWGAAARPLFGNPAPMVTPYGQQQAQWGAPAPVPQFIPVNPGIPRQQWGYNDIQPLAAPPAWVPNGARRFQTDVDSIYGSNNPGTKTANYFQGAPIPTASPTREYTSAPQVSRAQPQPTQQQQQQQQYDQATKQLQIMEDYHKLVESVEIEDTSDKVNEKNYPDDPWGNKAHCLEVLRACQLKYLEFVEKTNEAKKAKANLVHHDISLHGEAPVSAKAAIKRVEASSVNYGTADQKFAHHIRYREQKVLSIPYSIGKDCHDKLEAMLADEEKYDVAHLQINGINIAKDMIKQLRKSNPQYQKAITPILLKRWNDYMSVASAIHLPNGNIRVMNVENLDDLFEALSVGSAMKYADFKAKESYTDIVMSALKNSLFAIYEPCGGGNYLRIDVDADREAIMANPDANIVVNYSTPRYQPALGTKVKQEEFDKAVTNKLKQCFVITIETDILYTNLPVPLKCNDTTSFKLKNFDYTKGATNILTTLGTTMPGNWENSITYLMTTADSTTEVLPYVIARTLSNRYLARRVIA